MLFIVIQILTSQYLQLVLEEDDIILRMPESPEIEPQILKTPQSSKITPKRNLKRKREDEDYDVKKKFLEIAEKQAEAFKVCCKNLCSLQN